MSDLTIEHLSKFFGAATALDNISLNVPEGKLVCFLGPSGCGKTTLLRIIAGLDMPDEGKVMFGTDDITQTPASRRNFGMVFQSLALFPHMTVAGNIAYPLRLRRLDKAAQQRRVTEMLELIQLPHMAQRPVAQLSGGQRQRVAIARAIASSPRLLLLDEPLSALDAKLRESMKIEIRQLQRRLGISMIMVTHDQREAMTMADQIVVMEGGRIAQVGTPLEIYRHPVNGFVADFIGLGNLLPVTRDASGAVRLSGGQPIVLSGVYPDHSKSLRLLIRPEDVFIRRPEAVCGPNRLEGTITFVRDLGASLEATVDCAGVVLKAATTSRESPGLSIGTQVVADLPVESCRLVAA